MLFGSGVIPALWQIIISPPSASEPVSKTLKETHPQQGLSFNNPAFCVSAGGGRGSWGPLSLWSWLLALEGGTAQILSIETSTQANPSNRQAYLPPGISDAKSDHWSEGGRKQEVSQAGWGRGRCWLGHFISLESALKGAKWVDSFPLLKEPFHRLSACCPWRCLKCCTGGETALFTTGKSPKWASWGWELPEPSGRPFN